MFETQFRAFLCLMFFTDRWMPAYIRSLGGGGDRGSGDTFWLWGLYTAGRDVGGVCWQGSELACEESEEDRRNEDQITPSTFFIVPLINSTPDRSLPKSTTYIIIYPPSTGRFTPCTHPTSSLARNNTAFATSSGSPIPPYGCARSISACREASSWRF